MSVQISNCVRVLEAYLTRKTLLLPDLLQLEIDPPLMRTSAKLVHFRWFLTW